MKKLFIFFISVIFLTACKKETPSKEMPNSKPSSNNNSISVTCDDNPNINFNAIGTSVGKIGDCIKDIDGNIYKTVTIGTQTWMAENLNVSKYNDGTAINNIKDNAAWVSNKTGAWCYYDDDTSKNLKYGKLYNWSAVSITMNGNRNFVLQVGMSPRMLNGQY